MIKSFIDSNVFVHWIILKKMESERPEKDTLWTEFKKVKPSFELLERIRKNDLTKRKGFSTTPYHYSFQLSQIISF